MTTFNPVSNNKRIAKNTVTLYFRTLVVLVISLYTSRLVLKALGAEDLGIYNVVGGIVALLVFIRATLSSSTSRFITYELGKGSNVHDINRVFSAAMSIHLIIVACVILLGETLGLFIFFNWIEIPVERHTAALIVYHCALVMFCINLLSSPYESIIIAKEEMQVFAFISIINAILQLGLAVLLIRCNSDRLILYGLIMTLITVVVFFCYYFYIRSKHSEYKYRVLWDSYYSRQMFSFSGWTLLGASTNAATQQGVSILFNNFVGLIANAALGFANQVNAALQSFVGSFRLSFNPQVIKYYAQHDLPQMHLLMNRASKFGFMLAYVIALPLIVNMDYVLHIWLEEVPKYTVEFCQLILICTIIDSTTGVLNTGITATGNIRGFQIGISISFFLDLITASLLLVLHLSPTLVFGSRIITRGGINMLIELYFVRKQLSFSLRRYIIEVLIPIIFALAFTIPFIWLIGGTLNSLNGLMLSILISVISCAFITLFVFLNRDERKTVYKMVKNRIKNEI